MSVEQILHMNGGDEEASYATHSLIQRTVISLARPVLEESVLGLCTSRVRADCLVVADLGCSAGPNTLLVVTEILEIIAAACQRMDTPPPSLQAFLNDLSNSDFNSVFRSLPGFYQKLENDRKGNRIMGSCFIAGVAGSFYGRLFPTHSVHFFHSSYSLMWLSKIPKAVTGEGDEVLNKGNICVTKTSPPEVYKAYLEQFTRDFSLFLKSRAEELIPGGRMVLTIMGSIRSDDPKSMMEVLGFKLNDMVHEGLIDEAKLDSFIMPLYMATKEEVKKIVEVEGSFTLRKLEVIEMYWDDPLKRANSELDTQARAAILATDMRAVTEPILANHFGKELMNDLFYRLERAFQDRMVAELDNCRLINLVISLEKRE